MSRCKRRHQRLTELLLYTAADPRSLVITEQLGDWRRNYSTLTTHHTPVHGMRPSSVTDFVSSSRTSLRRSPTQQLPVCLMLQGIIDKQASGKNHAYWPVTVDEVVKLVRSLPSKSSPRLHAKSNVDVMASLIARLANMSFSSGVLPSPLKQQC